MTLMWPTLIWSLKRRHFKAICLVRKRVLSMVATTMQEALSSKMHVVSKVDVLVVLNAGDRGVLTKLC